MSSTKKEGENADYKQDMVVNQFGKDNENFNKFLIVKNFSRQALHASHLGFFHPTLKKNVKFNSKFPDDITNLINFLVKY